MPGLDDDRHDGRGADGRHVGPQGKLGDQAEVPEDEQHGQRQRGDHVAQHQGRHALGRIHHVSEVGALDPGRGDLGGVDPPVSTRAT